MVYKWSFFQYSVDANIVGHTIENIEKANGECTAKMLLDEARAEESPIHELFEWDDSIAAEKYRLKQATEIITAIAVVIEDNLETPKKVRAFANVGARHKGSFIPMTTALAKEESRKVVLQHALEELKEFKAKYKNLEELAAIFSEIERLQEAI